jgi:hypothetical protein
MVEGQQRWRPGLMPQGNRLLRSRFDRRPVRLSHAPDEQGTETSQLFGWHFALRQAIGKFDAGKPVGRCHSAPA